MTTSDVAVLLNARDTICDYCANTNCNNDYEACETCIVAHLASEAVNDCPEFNE